MKMINLVVGGATGKLGKIVCDMAVASEDIELVGAIVSPNGGHAGKELYPGICASTPDKLFDLLDDADVYVDLTTPAAASKIIGKIPETGTNVIVGTTAVDQKSIDEMVANAKKYKTSALVSSNFAIGVNVFWKMCENLAEKLPDYDVEIVETHHSMKKDAPSGTAKEAVKRIQNATKIDDVIYGRKGVTGPRGREICVHSIRAGDVVGDHTVIFAKNMERIELTHKAISREAFASGCIETIRWISKKKDGKLHTMDEVLGL